MARISTHVLDTSAGIPAVGVRVTLYRLEHGRRPLIADAITDADGRTEVPLFAADRMAVGIHELEFGAGAYFRARGIALRDPPFLDIVIIRFGVADAAGEYHVPLLVSPYGYTTYRGT
jgi:5-hydroxyisourate hydrolase